MKKLIILAIFSLILSISFAQIPGNIGFNNYYDSQKNLGIKGGINFSNIHGKDVEDTKSKTGFIVGFFYDIPCTDQFSIQPEILFSMKGWRYEYTDDDWYDYSYKYWGKLNYIEIPILGKFKLNSINNINPCVYFGPCFGFNVSSTYRYEWEDYEENDTDTGSMEDVSVFEFSLTPGVMLEFNNQYVFDFRYSIGLTDIFSDNEGFDPVKYSVISLMLGVKL
ncbi:MAG: porin family protein [Candidatus Celaenobacter antarcticus]|nr:porin family protein [Candidatus Celaenobacter antarcticus]